MGIGKDKCDHCGLARTPEGHDGCIGSLDNVANACCGHGETKSAYVQFFHPDYKDNPNAKRISASEALDYIKGNRKITRAAACK
ncbi:hypothetical protein [Flagellimonas sp.]|uniref:hypothetical protein n=1 Tax=Flagellimonas sp. TaxID=2058762 RepID=UPI003BABAF42